MKYGIKKWLLPLMCFALTPLFANAATEHDFNFDWKFSLAGGEENAYKLKYDDSSWQEVRLPHDWSIELGYTQSNTAGSNGFLPGGIGWYRKNFKIESSKRNQKYFIHFEGVYEFAEVWINDVYLGLYPCGYLGFEYDLTPYLRYGDKENVIAVKVDRSAYADARWYVGAGIYRNVKLLERGENYIASDGIFITTPSVSRDKAEISISVDIVRGAKTNLPIEIINELFNGEQSVLKSSLDEVLSSEKCSFNHKLSLENPSLWTLDVPTVYRLETTIMSGDTILDSTRSTFGIRSMEFDAARGLLINNRPIKIKGVNIHHDLGCVGVALYDAVLYRRLKTLKDMGCNAIRTAHNPHSISLLNMCDTMGLLVMNEMFDEWRVAKDKWITDRSAGHAPEALSVGYTHYFNQWAESDLKSFIRRDRNHPSLMLWSIGNELEWTYPYYWRASAEGSGVDGLVHLGGPEIQNDTIINRFYRYCNGYDELSATAKELVGWVKDVDTTHKVTLGANLPSVSRLSGLMKVLDVVGYNYKNSYYEIDHERYPDQPILGTENYGQYHEWRAVEDKDYISGIFVWTGISYLGESGPWPNKGSNSSFIDFAGFKQSRGHFFEALWSERPKTHIVTTPAADCEFKLNNDGTFRAEFNDEMRRSEHRGWAWFKTYDKWNYEDGEAIVIQVYSNAPQVELFVNGISHGTKNRADFAKENILLWQVDYTPGEVVAIGKINGHEVSRHSLHTNGDCDAIKLKSDKSHVKADMYDVAHITVELIDNNGVMVNDADQEVEFIVDNKLRILGVDNGSSSYVGSHKTNKIITHNGKCLLIVQSKNRDKGRYIVKARLASGAEQSIAIDFI